MQEGGAMVQTFKHFKEILQKMHTPPPSLKIDHEIQYSHLIGKYSKIRFSSNGEKSHFVNSLHNFLEKDEYL